MHIGQSIVSREILQRLDPDRWDVTALGFADVKIREGQSVETNLKIVNVFRSNMHDADWITEQLAALNPEIVVFSHDIFLWTTIEEVSGRLPHVKFVGYITVDGIPIFSGWRKLFYAYDHLIMPTNWAKDELIAKWLDLDVSVIPYGLNHDLFHPPANGKEQMKKDVQGAARQSESVSQRMVVEDKFVGLFVGANQTRKNLGAVYAGWKKFAEGKDDVVFFLLTHSASIESDDVGEYSIGMFLDANGMQIVPKQIPIGWLVRFFAMSDVLLHPATNEGFGMTIVEAMACGTIPVVCDYSGHTDFCNDETAYIVDWTEFIGARNTIKAVAIHDSVAQKLEEAYQDWKSGAIESKREAAVQMACQYSWDDTAKEMDRTLTEILDRREARLVVKHIL